jgi:hypothetical protein
LNLIQTVRAPTIIKMVYFVWTNFCLACCCVYCQLPTANPFLPSCQNVLNILRGPGTILWNKIRKVYNILSAKIMKNTKLGTFLSLPKSLFCYQPKVSLQKKQEAPKNLQTNLFGRRKKLIFNCLYISRYNLLPKFYPCWLSQLRERRHL